MKRGEKRTVEIVGLDRVLTTLRGKPIKIRDFGGEDGTTLADWLFETAQREFDHQSDEERLDSYEVAKQLQLPTDKVMLSPEEVTLMKKKALKSWPQVIGCAIHDALTNGGLRDPKPAGKAEAKNEDLVPVTAGTE